ncbi:MAG: MerR family DNA-binding transcriptional regulator [Cyanobacteria bacterium]|nr:MerR family DNA-binding transcriptional regulator [Cyanobacteriota bacterium]
MALWCSLSLLESQVLVAAPLKIGEVARRSGLTVKTIRFYCDEGLIHPISRSEGGYRLFGDAVFAELALIRTLKTMDIPLGDVTRILESRRSGLCTCASLQATIRGKADAIEQKIANLHHLHQELNALLRSWEDCGGRKP